MKEALPYIISYGFREVQLNRLEAFIHPDNRTSRRLVEGVGFVREGLLKEHHNDHGVLGDSMLYRLLRNEYKG
jgi:ribosomal-protein-alanine N-acetyltransferase